MDAGARITYRLLMYSADLYLRSTFSEGKLTIPELVDLHGARGIGAIAIVDPVLGTRGVAGRASGLVRRALTASTFPLYIEIIRSEAERAWERYRMVVIPGFELVTRLGAPGLIGLGISEFLPADRGVDELAEAIRAQGGLPLAGVPAPPRARFTFADIRRSPRARGWRTVFEGERDAGAILAELRRRGLEYGAVRDGDAPGFGAPAIRLPRAEVSS